MKKRTIKNLSALLLASMLALSACGSQGAKESSVPEENKTQEVSQETTVSSEPKEEVKEIRKVSLYPGNANLLSGTVSGFKGDFFAESGLEVEVWAYSAEKTTAIMASGDLPDIMYVSPKNLETMIEQDMILCLDDYLDQIPNWQKYDEVLSVAENYMREYRSGNTGKLYAMPTTVGKSAEKAIPSVGTNPVKIRWDMYEGIGAPEIKSFDDLIDVMIQMKEKYPTDADGNKMFGTVLNSGSDSMFFKAMTAWWKWHGYDNGNMAANYLLEADMATGEVSSILEDDSIYRQGLEWYNRVYREGLLDPDSINVGRSTQNKKIDSGLAYVPSGFLPGYAPTYYEYYIPGTSIYNSDSKPYGAQSYIVINKKTTNLEACLDFINLLMDPFSYLNLNYGPEGDMWYIDGEDIYLTDRCKAYLEKNNWAINGYIHETGEEFSIFNTAFITHTGTKLEYKDGNGNYRYPMITNWSEFAAARAGDETLKNWKATTGYDNFVEWLEAEDALYTTSPLDNVSEFLTAADSERSLLLNAVKDVVVNASWKMVYAESDDEFNKIWDQMVADCMELDAQKQLIEWRMADIENAKAIVESLKK